MSSVKASTKTMINSSLRKIIRETVHDVTSLWNNVVESTLQKVLRKLLQRRLQRDGISTAGAKGFLRYLVMQKNRLHVSVPTFLDVPHFQFDTDDLQILGEYTQVRSSRDNIGKMIHLSTYRLSPHDLCTLHPREWLNDQIINAFVAACCHSTAGRVRFLGSFFLTKLMQKTGAEGVRRWITKLHLKGDEEKILIPINVRGNHWSLGVINFSERCVEYYDSYMSSHRNKWNEVLHYDPSISPSAKALADCCAVLFPKLGIDRIHNTVNLVPQQNNAYDCGVFTCRFACALCQTSERREFQFRQQDMDHSRCQILLNLTFLDKC